VLLNLLLGAMFPVVDNWAHLGGLAGGALLTFAIGPNLQWEGRTLVDRPLLPWRGR
jgi:membrane associated rhomboid family serine protease